jgi:hypothetical protein
MAQKIAAVVVKPGACCICVAYWFIIKVFINVLLYYKKKRDRIFPA